MIWVLNFSHRCDQGLKSCRMWPLIGGWIVCNIWNKYIPFVPKGQVLTLENDYIPHIPKVHNPCSYCDWQGPITLHDHHHCTHKVQCRCALCSFILMFSPVFHITNLVTLVLFISPYRSLQNNNKHFKKWEQ
jgi:hypothetical protein